MTIKEAKIKLAEAKEKEQEALQAVVAARKVACEKSALWNPHFQAVRELEAFIKFMEADNE